MKKVISLALAMCMILAMAVPALATNLTDPSAASTTGANTTLTGTIAATKINVTVPATVAFTLDPTITASTVTDQIIAPSNIEIKNDSVVPVYAKVTAVAVTGGVTLVTDTSSLNTDKAAMLSFKETGKVTDFTTAADWMTTSVSTSAPYALNAADGRIEAGNTMTMQICGQSQQGWQAGDTFTVTPTVVVSVTK